MIVKRYCLTWMEADKIEDGTKGGKSEYIED